MREQSRFVLSVIAAVLSVVVLGNVAFAQVRTSTNYQLQSDSINVGGGFGTSTSFISESTIGEIATGDSASASFQLRAGYQQMQEVFLSLGGVSDITMTPEIPGVTGGTSNGSTTVTVVTDSPAGYQLLIAAANNPAMQRADATPINNYTPTGGADLLFSVPPVSAEFGFTAEGADAALQFLDNTTTCGVGSNSTPATCWAALLNSQIEIASAGSANHPSGATTTVRFRVGVSSGAAIPQGSYVATTTLTALPL